MVWIRTLQLCIYFHQGRIVPEYRTRVTDRKVWCLEPMPVCVWLGAAQALLLVRQCPVSRPPRLGHLSINQSINQPHSGSADPAPDWPSDQKSHLRERPMKNQGLKRGWPWSGPSSGPCLLLEFLTHAGILGIGSRMCGFLYLFCLSLLLILFLVKHFLVTQYLTGLRVSRLNGLHKC